MSCCCYCYYSYCYYSYYPLLLLPLATTPLATATPPPGGHIISDGGCTCPGDVAKAFGAGADFVMMGGMLAGHDQSGGEVLLLLLLSCYSYLLR